MEPHWVSGSNNKHRNLYLRDETSTSIASRQVESALAISLLVLGIVLSVRYCFLWLWKQNPTTGTTYIVNNSCTPQHNLSEELLTDDELLRLWICKYCDFANYESKFCCALCRNDKVEKKIINTGEREITHEVAAAQLNTTGHAFSIVGHELTRSISNSLSFSKSNKPRMSMYVSNSKLSQPATEVNSHSTPRIQTWQADAISGNARKEWITHVHENRTVVWRYYYTGENQSMKQNNSIISSQIPLALIHASAFVSRQIPSEKKFGCGMELKEGYGKMTTESAENAAVYPFAELAGNEFSDLVNDEQRNFLPKGLLADPLSLNSLRHLCFPEKHRWFLQELTAMRQRLCTHSIHYSGRDFSTMQETNFVHIDSSLNHSSTSVFSIHAPRNHILESTAYDLMRANPLQMQYPLRVCFINEPGIDAGGIIREWTTLVLEEYLKPSNGLFVCRHTDAGIEYHINPNISLAKENHLYYLCSFGRFIGISLLHGQLLDLPLAAILLKHLLGHPMSIADFNRIDPEIVNSLQILWKTNLSFDLKTDGNQINDKGLNTNDWRETIVSSNYSQGVSDCYAIDFSIFHSGMGVVDLKPNGRNIPVNEENKREYISLFVKWQLSDSLSKEISALITGFYDVVPHYLLSPFDYEELRLILCGSPSLDIDDWQEHTVVTGYGNKHTRSVHWFWQILRGFSRENQCKLLHYVTGSSRVPVQGFKALTSSSQNLCPFTIYCFPKRECPAPRAYTCFNRLDLPMYRSEKELRQALELIIEADVTGFSIQ